MFLVFISTVRKQISQSFSPLIIKILYFQNLLLMKVLVKCFRSMFRLKKKITWTYLRSRKDGGKTRRELAKTTVELFLLLSMKTNHLQKKEVSFYPNIHILKECLVSLNNLLLTTI